MKKYFIFLLVGMFLISFASAWTSSEFTKDEIKSLDKLTNFGTYTIKESAWYDPLKIWTEETIKTINLESNTDSCGQNCKAQMRFNLLKDGVLIEDSKFLDVENKMKETTIRSSSVWIWDNPKQSTESYLENECTYTEEGNETCSLVSKERSYYYKLVDDYKYVCEKTGELSKNGTDIEECRNEVVGQKEYRYDGWVRYNTGDEVVTGEYLVELRGNKPFDKEIDWQIKVDGVWTSVWAIWGFSDMTEGLVAQYRANTQDFSVKNQTQVLDFTGSNNGTLLGKTFNDGTVSGGVTIEDGAMKFGGVNGYVSVPISTGLNISESITFSAWVKHSNTAGNLYIAGREPQTYEAWVINKVANTNVIQVQLSANATQRQYFATTTPIIENQWTLVTFKYDFSTKNVSIYFNGIEQNQSSTKTYAFNTLRIDTNNGISIGRRSSGNYWNGSLDDVLIFNRALSQDEITQLYNQGRGQYSSVTNGLVAQYSGRDYAGSPENVTKVYDTNHLGDGKVLQSMSFDGVNDYVNGTVFNITQEKNYTYSVWLKPISTPLSNQQNIIVNQINPNNRAILALTSSRTLSGAFYNGAEYIGIKSSTVLNLNEYYHAVYSYSNGIGNLYLNGAIQTGTTTPSTGGNFGFSIGSQADKTGRFFNGSIDDVRIYNRSLSADEIAYLYNSGLGREDSSDAWIEVNSPANNSIQYTNSVTVNASAYVESGAYLTNASLNLSVNGGAWGVVNTTDLSTISGGGLVSYYTLDEISGTTAYDSLLRNNGTISGATINKIGLIDKAYSFNGVNNYVNFGNRQFSPTSNWSINMWINTSNNAGKTEFLFGKDTGSAGGQYVTVYLDNGYLRGAYRNGGCISSNLGVFLGTNTWQMITWVMNGTHVNLYNNNTMFCSGAVGTGDNGINQDVYFGRRSSGDYYSGLIDEVGIWNRTLTQAEITQLYNSGAGSRPGTTTQTFTNTFNAGDVVDFNYEFCDTDGDCGQSETRRFTIDSTAPTITLNYPTSLIDYGKINGTLELNFTATDTNLDKVWYNYNGTNVTIAGAVSGVYNVSNITLSTKKNVTIYANDTAGNLNTTTFSWDYKVFEIGQTYSTEVYETMSSDFSINLTYNSSQYALITKINYDNVNYSASENSQGIFSSSFEIPVTTNSTNKSFYWIISAQNLLNITDNPIIQTDVMTQTISTINISKCSGGNVTLVFKAYDEENMTALTPYNFLGTFYYWIGSGNSKKNISINDLNVNESRLCLTPANIGYRTDAIIQYEKDGYVKRNYYFYNASLTNTTQNVSLYLLASGSSTSFIVQIRDKSQLAVRNAYVYSQRYYPGTGTYETVAMGKTDDNGNTVLHFEAETEDYRIIVMQDGVVRYTSPVQKVYCSATPCTLPIQIESGGVVGWSNFGNLSNLIYTGPYYDNTTQEIIFTYIDTSGTTSYGRLFVYEYINNIKTTICNTNSTANAATLTCDVSGVEGTIFAEGYLSRSPEVLVWAKQFVINTIKAVMGMEGLFWGVIAILVVAIAGALIGGVSGGVFGIVAGMWGVQLLQIASFGLITTWGVTVIGIIILWNIRN